MSPRDWRASRGGRNALICIKTIRWSRAQPVMSVGPKQMIPRSSLLRCLIAGLLACSAASADAAGSRELRNRGKVILENNCGRCHAIGAVGASPMAQAPPMRDVYARFLPRELQAELREGMVSKHRAMPQIDFSDEDVDAILAYLYALAIRI